MSNDEPLRATPLRELWRIQGFNTEESMPDHKTPQPIPLITIEETMRANNLLHYLETEALKAGTDDQRERYAVHVLPEDELTQLARAELFKGFGDLDQRGAQAMRRWARRDRDALVRQLKHTASCDRPGAVLESCEVTELEPDEWKRLKAITLMASAAAQHPWLDPVRTGGRVDVTTTAHWATCQHCKAEVVRTSAKVTITWAGRQLVREWAL